MSYFPRYSMIHCTCSPPRPHKGTAIRNNTGRLSVRSRENDLRRFRFPCSRLSRHHDGLVSGLATGTQTHLVVRQLQNDERRRNLSIYSWCVRRVALETSVFTLRGLPARVLIDVCFLGETKATNCWNVDYACVSSANRAMETSNCSLVWRRIILWSRGSAYLSDSIRVWGLWVEGAIHVLAHLWVGYVPQRVDSDQNGTLYVNEQMRY